MLIASTNRTTEYVYTLEGQLAILIARNAETGDQVTRWHYGTTLGESGVASHSLLRAKVYPESDDGGPGLNGPDSWRHEFGLWFWRWKTMLQGQLR